MWKIVKINKNLGKHSNLKQFKAFQSNPSDRIFGAIKNQQKFLLMILYTYIKNDGDDFF